MTEDNGSRSSARMMMGLAAASVVAALVLVFGLGGDDQEEPAASALTARPAPEAAAVPRPGPPEPAPMIADAQTAQQPAALEPSSAGEYALPNAPPPWEPLSARIPPALEEEATRPMPEHVAQAFARGSVPISKERLAEMRQGIPEIPLHIEREMEDAANQPIPAELLDDFQNPYPTIPAEELEMLRQNGRNPGSR